MVLCSFSAPPQLVHAVARIHLPDVDELGFEIAPRRDVAQMVIVLIGAGDHVAARFEREIGDDRHVRDADGPERSGVGAEPVVDLAGCAGRTSSAPPAAAANFVSLS